MRKSPGQGRVLVKAFSLAIAHWEEPFKQPAACCQAAVLRLALLQAHALFLCFSRAYYFKSSTAVIRVLVLRLETESSPEVLLV